MKSRKQLKEERDKASNIYFGAALLIIFLLNFVEKIITAISHIFPFNYLLQGNRFHYSHWALMKAWDDIIEVNKQLGIHYTIKRVQEDDYFYCYIGKFNRNLAREKINKYLAMLEQKYKQGNVFLRKSPEGLTSINIIKEAVDFGDILG